MTDGDYGMGKFAKAMCDIQDVRNELNMNVLNDDDKMLLAAYDAFARLYRNYCIRNIMKRMVDIIGDIEEGQK